MMFDLKFICDSEKPSVTNCVLTATVADYAASTGNNGCTPKLANWSPLTWTCTQTTQQDSSKNAYYMSVSSSDFNIVSFFKIYFDPSLIRQQEPVF